MKTITIPMHQTTLVQLLKRTPSALVRSAMYRGGAGVHADQRGRYSKRDRAKNRAEARQAMLHSDGG